MDLFPRDLQGGGFFLYPETVRSIPGPHCRGANDYRAPLALWAGWEITKYGNGRLMGPLRPLTPPVS